MSKASLRTINRTIAPPPPEWLAKLRRDPAARVALKAWRELTKGESDGDRPTLLACSGGTDSSGLVLALACQATGVRSTLIVAHIVHDLRPAAQARRDLAITKDLARLVGLKCVQATVKVKAQAGNAEANAREARYKALGKLAEKHGCRFIATAHHADDQLETVLMRLIRGAGPRGLVGIRPSRLLDREHSKLLLIRPMLEVERVDTERLVRHVPEPWKPAQDETNADLSRLRNAIRSKITPLLKELSPSVAKRVARNSRWFRDVKDR